MKTNSPFSALSTIFYISFYLISDDNRPEAQHVLNNNVKILELINQCVTFAEDSTHILDKAFGPSAKGGPPRIGEE